ncbi:MAG: hypothetical protein QXF35_02355 [Candidatus Bilamarchaeaceae archaeon]
MALLSIKPKSRYTKDAVLAEIEKGDIKSASKIVFNFTHSDKENFESKKEVIKKFCDKYGEKALSYIYDYAFRIYGLTFTSPQIFEKKYPHLVDEIKSLAYGFSYFGYDGFRAIARLVYSSVQPSVNVFTNNYPLSVSLAYATCILFKKEKKSSDEMYNHIKEYLLKGDLKETSKLVFVTMIKLLDFSDKLRSDGDIPEKTKNMLR